MTTYKTLEELVNAAKSGTFIGTVTVDNDSVYAYLDDDEDANQAFDFNGDGPEDALIKALTLLGLKAERA